MIRKTALNIMKSTQKVHYTKEEIIRESKNRSINKLPANYTTKQKH